MNLLLGLKITRAQPILRLHSKAIEAFLMKRGIANIALMHFCTDDDQNVLATYFFFALCKCGILSFITLVMTMSSLTTNNRCTHPYSHALCRLHILPRLRFRLHTVAI